MTPSTEAPAREARLYEKQAEGKVRCHLCAHRCVIPEGKPGICQVRENRSGVLYTLVYGRAISRNVDPVEKKPLYHFHPGSQAYSVATPGCNFRCRWCQNFEISQMPREQHVIAGREAPPDEIVRDARQTGCRSIAYTYTEPTIFTEYAYDIARLAHAADVANIYVTNGYMTVEMLEAFHPYLDGANVDLKGFRDRTYRKFAGARLDPVLDALKAMVRLGVWIEVTTLVIPTVNDEKDELRDVTRFIVDELGADTPWHISRFFPTYQMIDVPPTPVKSLRAARDIGLEEGLRHVYLGNVGGEDQDTKCPGCGAVVIRRGGYSIVDNRVTAGRCPECSASIAGVGMDGG